MGMNQSDEVDAMNNYKRKIKETPNIEHRTEDILERVKEILNKKY